MLLIIFINHINQESRGHKLTAQVLVYYYFYLFSISTILLKIQKQLNLNPIFIEITFKSLNCIIKNIIKMCVNVIVLYFKTMFIYAWWISLSLHHHLTYTAYLCWVIYLMVCMRNFLSTVFWLTCATPGVKRIKYNAKNK